MASDLQDSGIRDSGVLYEAGLVPPESVDPERELVAQLIKRHQAGVWRYLRALGCDCSEADDLTQETFLTILERPFEDYSDAATAVYLRKVAYNLLVTVRRRSGRVTAVENVEELDAAWNEWVHDDQGNELLDLLRACLGRLTERARHALEMRFRLKSSRAEIAAALEMTEHGAKNLMQRAKKTLKQCVENKLKV